MRRRDSIAIGVAVLAMQAAFLIALHFILHQRHPGHERSRPHPLGLPRPRVHDQCRVVHGKDGRLSTPGTLRE
jgi:hypothetical protein